MLVNFDNTVYAVIYPENCKLIDTFLGHISMYGKGNIVFVISDFVSAVIPDPCCPGTTYALGTIKMAR